MMPSSATPGGRGVAALGPRAAVHNATLAGPSGNAAAMASCSEVPAPSTTALAMSAGRPARGRRALSATDSSSHGGDCGARNDCGGDSDGSPAAAVYVVRRQRMGYIGLLRHWWAQVGSSACLGFSEGVLPTLPLAAGRRHRAARRAGSGASAPAPTAACVISAIPTTSGALDSSRLHVRRHGSSRRPAAAHSSQADREPVLLQALRVPPPQRWVVRLDGPLTRVLHQLENRLVGGGGVEGHKVPGPPDGPE
jgi:hypothetical protein